MTHLSSSISILTGKRNATVFLSCMSLMRYDFIHIDGGFFIISIDFLKLNLSFLSNTFSSSAISSCLSQHKIKFWTGIRQKIRCGMVLVGMDSI